MLRVNLQKIHDRIEKAAKAAGRSASEIDLLAVTKGHGLEQIIMLHALGQKSYGENYYQEMHGKASQLKDARWVFIGSLQSNKIPKIVALAAEIQTVASLKHAQAIEAAASSLNKLPYPIYIAVNLDPLLEPRKSGIALSGVSSFAATLTEKLPGLLVQGLFAVPPPLAEKTTGKTDSKMPLHYQNLANEAKKVGAGKLSLGMSDDLELAIRAGSTCVRIGSALLGARTSSL